MQSTALAEAFNTLTSRIDDDTRRLPHQTEITLSSLMRQGRP